MGVPVPRPNRGGQAARTTRSFPFASGVWRSPCGEDGRGPACSHDQWAGDDAPRPSSQWARSRQPSPSRGSPPPILLFAATNRAPSTSHRPGNPEAAAPSIILTHGHRVRVLSRFCAPSRSRVALSVARERHVQVRPGCQGFQSANKRRAAVRTGGCNVRSGLRTGRAPALTHRPASVMAGPPALAARGGKAVFPGGKPVGAGDPCCAPRPSPSPPGQPTPVPEHLSSLLDGCRPPAQDPSLTATPASWAPVPIPPSSFQTHFLPELALRSMLVARVPSPASLAPSSQ